jgi:hypothetical protein
MCCGLKVGLGCQCCSSVVLSCEPPLSSSTNPNHSVGPLAIASAFRTALRPQQNPLMVPERRRRALDADPDVNEIPERSQA